MADGSERPRNLHDANEKIDELLAKSNPDLSKEVASLKAERDTLQKQLKGKDVSISALATSLNKQKQQLQSETPKAPGTVSISAQIESLRAQTSAEKDSRKLHALYTQLKALEKVPRGIVHSKDGDKEFVQTADQYGRKTWTEVPNTK